VNAFAAIVVGFGLWLLQGGGKKPAAAAPPAAAAKLPAASVLPDRPWQRETASQLRLVVTRQYCATVDVAGLRGVLASASDVTDELEALVPWRSIAAFSSRSELPPGLPLERLEDESGRFWIVGQPNSSATFTRDDQITELWSRAV
jgi:hypothetical protein